MRTHWWVAAACAFVVAVPAIAQNSLDPFFSTVPFNGWVTSPGAGQIPLKVSADPPMLDDFQRLQLTVNVSVDGSDMAKRPPTGHLQFFLQFSDAARHIYQGHGDLDLKEMKPNIKASDIVYAHSVLILPGDYQVTMAVYDTETREHGIARKTVRVPVLKDDPLPMAWRNMPPVEFLTATERPDSWFQPDLRGRLFLPLELHTPTRIDLVMILPDEIGSIDYQNQLRGRLVAALKDFSQLDTTGSSMAAAVLDLTRRRTAFQQDLAPDLAGSKPPLDWPKLVEAFNEANPSTIDVGSLANRGKGADFFVQEIKRRLESTEKAQPRRVLIILTAPMLFPSGAEIRPIQLEKPSNAEIYYLRIQGVFLHQGRRPIEMIGTPSQSAGRQRRGAGRYPGRDMRERDDSLEATLKPLSPHLFDIHSPQEFRKAIAAVLVDLAKR